MPHRIAVVGGGISGLAFAHRLRAIRPDAEIVVLERAAQPGGKVRTSHRDGYTVEWGPNGFLTQATDTLDLARELGLEDRLVVAAPAAERRYLFRDHALRPLPTGPRSFLASDLLSLPSKLRAALEPALATRSDGEETVHGFLARHIGQGPANALAEAMVLGVTGGDPNRLSVDALFPRLRELERQHRSLLLGMMASQRAARTRRAAGSDSTAAEAPEPGSPGGRLTTFRSGTGELIDALADALGDAVRTGVEVCSVTPAPNGVRLELEVDSSADVLEADALVLATPAFTTADLVDVWAPDAARQLREIPFAPIRVLALGYDRIDVPRVLDGFGFLAPSGEGVRSLGVLWSSTIFPDHASPGRVLLRILAGGMRDPDIVDLDDDAALAAVRDDLRRTMGITAEPAFVEQVAWPRAIPQYELGHLQRIARIEAQLAAAAAAAVHVRDGGTSREAPHPWGSRLMLVGNSYRGVGLNDCVRESRAAADRLAESLGSPAPG